MGKRQMPEIDSLFLEDVEQYYKLFKEYIELAPEDYGQAYNLAKRALALADRWNDLMVDAKKLSNAKDINKTDLSKYCYGKYRQMQLIHEHCRMIWNKGEEAIRLKKYKAD